MLWSDESKNWNFWIKLMSVCTDKCLQPTVKTRWRFSHGVGLHLNHWCWEFCQNIWTQYLPPPTQTSDLWSDMQSDWQWPNFSARRCQKTQQIPVLKMDWPPQSHCVRESYCIACVSIFAKSEKNIRTLCYQTPVILSWTLEAAFAWW